MAAQEYYAVFDDLYGSPVKMNDRFESVHIWSEELAHRNKGRWKPKLISLIEFEKSKK